MADVELRCGSAPSECVSFARLSIHIDGVKTEQTRSELAEKEEKK